METVTFGASSTRVEVGPTIEAFVASVKGAVGATDVPALKTALARRIRVIPVTAENAHEERQSRYMRTSEQILSEGWVYRDHIGDDLVTVIQGVLKALKIDSRYVAVHEPLTRMEKIKRWWGKHAIDRPIRFHAICEARFHEGTCLVDVVASNPVAKGAFGKDREISFGNTSWVMFCSGRDSWEIGLKEAGTSMFVFDAIVGKMSIY